jgi:hypothetical protein
MLQEIKKFILEANQAGYASGNSGVGESDGSKTIAFENGDWKYHDNYFGGEPYGGREVVSFKGKPIWMMLYYGWVVPDPDLDIKKVYGFLQEALRAIPDDNPYRGPRFFQSGGMTYINSWRGEMDSFSGEEKIYFGGKEIYAATYLGGLIDLRRE